jgi:hypothetical protein
LLALGSGVVEFDEPLQFVSAIVESSDSAITADIVLGEFILGCYSCRVFVFAKYCVGTRCFENQRVKKCLAPWRVRLPERGVRGKGERIRPSRVRLPTRVT